MDAKRPLDYRDAGVLANAELGLDALLGWVRPTEAFRAGKLGRSVLDVGFFASVIDIGHGLGLALCTDGVGTKVLVAEMLERYETIGIDCVAMNVNDAICVGAEPVSFLDYIAIEHASPAILGAIGQGLHEGARQAGVNIVGGEISQIAEIVKGSKPGHGVDLVGMCVGIVPLDKVITGKDVRPGDVVLGLPSSGLHSNGYTLARKALFATAGLPPDRFVAELGRTVGEELLEPTRIYVAPVLELLRSGLPIRALANITGDGLLNLARVAAPVGFVIDQLPRPQPIFRMIQEAGSITDAEMYRVFNMGIGFCVVVPDDRAVVDAVTRTLAAHGCEARPIGHVTDDGARRVVLPQKGLVGQDDRFVESS